MNRTKNTDEQLDDVASQIAPQAQLDETLVLRAARRVSEQLYLRRCRKHQMNLAEAFQDGWRDRDDEIADAAKDAKRAKDAG